MLSLLVFENIFSNLVSIMKSNALIEKMAQASWFLFTRMKKRLSKANVCLMLFLIKYLVHLGPCIGIIS
jgi:hypothetical protein